MKKNIDSLVVTGLGDYSLLHKLRSNNIHYRLLQLCSILVENNHNVHFSDARNNSFSKNKLLEEICSRKYDCVFFDVYWYNCYETINIYNRISSDTICYFYCNDSLTYKILVKEGISCEKMINWKQKSFYIGGLLMSNILMHPIYPLLSKNNTYLKSVSNFDIDVYEELSQVITSDIRFVVQNGIKWINFNIDDNDFDFDTIIKLNHLINECMCDFIVSFSLPYKSISSFIDVAEKSELTKLLKKIYIRVKTEDISHLIGQIEDKCLLNILIKFDNIEIVFMMGNNSYTPLCKDNVKKIITLLDKNLKFTPDYSIEYVLEDTGELNKELKMNILKGYPIAEQCSLTIPEIKKYENELNTFIYSEYCTNIKKLCAQDRWKIARLADYGMITQLYYYFCMKTNIESLRIRSTIEKNIKNSWMLTHEQIMNSVPIIVAGTMCVSGKYYVILDNNLFNVPYIVLSDVEKEICDLTRSGYTLRKIVSRIKSKVKKNDVCDFVISFLKKLEKYDCAIFYVNSYMYDSFFLED